MARTNGTAIKGLLGDNYNQRDSIDPYLLAANKLVNRVEQYGIDTGVTLDDDTLEMIERVLGAHFYQHTDKGFASRSTGGSSASFEGESGKYLERTTYGQMAIQLDETGYLANMVQAAAEERSSKPATASGAWAGTPYSQQPDYEDRN